MKKIITGLLLTTCLLSSCGKDQKTEIVGGLGSGNNQGQDVNNQNVQLEDSFQIGDNWGRKFGNKRVLRYETNQIIKDFAPSVGRAVTFQNKGTAFYIGKHNGEYLVATNAHVLTNVPFCQMGPMLSPRFYFEDFADGLYCRQIIGSWKEIDLAIISLRVSRDQEYFFDRKEEFKFQKSASVDKFTELVTFGHGEVNNPSYKLTYDDSSDCKVLSQTNRFRSVLKEDDPLKHKIPSFATGCDISRGDSGSPVIDKSNGTLLGIIWGTRNKKPLKIKSSAYIHLLSEQNHEDIWKYMSFAIPTKEIFDRVEKSVRNDRMRYKNRLTLQLLFDIRN